MRGAALRLVLLAFAALVALWLLGALVQGLLVSFSLTTSRFFLFYWWFQKFGLGVVVGFVLGMLAGVFLSHRRSSNWHAVQAGPTEDHIDEAQRQLTALKKELAAEREENAPRD